MRRLVCLALVLAAWMGARPAGATSSPEFAARVTPLQLTHPPRQPVVLSQHLVITMADQHAERFDAAQAQVALATGPVLRLDHPLRELGRFRFPVWAGFGMQNTSAQPQALVLFLDQPTIEIAELFLWTEIGWRRIPGRHDTARLAFERDRYPSFEWTLQPGETAWMMVRQHTVSPMRFTLKAQTISSHHSDEIGSNMVLVPILCIPVAVGFMLITLKRLSHTEGLGLFLGFIASDLIGASWLTGLVPELFPRIEPIALRGMAQSAFGLVGLLGTLHLVGFLKVPLAIARWMVGYSAACLAAITLTMIFDPWLSARLTLGTSASMVLMNMVATILAWRAGRPYAGLYSVAWSVYFLSFVLYALYVAAIVPPHTWGFAVFMQSAGVCLLIGYTIARSMLDRDRRLVAALDQAEQQRRQIEGLSIERDRLFAAANHDLRQPLQALALNLELIQSRIQAVPDTEPIMGRMHTALASMGGMLTSLLDLRQADFTGNPPQLCAVALQPVLQRLAAQYREQARAKGITLRLVPTRLWVLANEAWLERALSNLITNALRYTDSGRVVLGARRTGANLVRILVIDTGRGIAAADVPRVFGEHQRLDRQNRPEHYGLGLYIVGRLASAMQAHVDVRSEPGRGSSFAIVMARQQPLPQRVTLQTTPPLPGPMPIRGRTVLVCDDDPVVLATLHDSLSQLGAGVSSATSAALACKLLAQSAFDVILSDLYFDGLPAGLEIQTFAKTHQPQALRLVMTGDPDALAHLVTDAGLLHRVLPKPVGLLALIEALNMMPRQQAGSL